MMPRIDRLLSLYCFNPLSKLGPEKIPGIPILMYHSISNGSEAEVHPYYRVNTAPDVFFRQMQYLNDEGYQVITLEQAAESLRDKRPRQMAHVKYVVITFDDGFRDFLAEAFPVLQRYRFPATVFLPTGFISKNEESFKGKRCLRWEEVRDLAASGVHFGSHTVTHSKLRELHWNQVEREIKESKEIIEDMIGSRVESFSYPFAFPEEDHNFKRNLRSSLSRLGYTRGVTTVIGTATYGDDELFLKRIPVNSDDDLVLFRAKLEGAYNWVHGPQYVFKCLKLFLNRNGRRLRDS